MNFMKEALKQAEIAFEQDEVPVGALVVENGKVIAVAHNQNLSLSDPTAHAEILALRIACEVKKSSRLDGCDLYVTLEPCAMCAGALILARVNRLIYGAPDPKTGACGSMFNIATSKKLNHTIKITKGILSVECGGLLKDFFKKKRKK